MSDTIFWHMVTVSAVSTGMSSKPFHFKLQDKPQMEGEAEHCEEASAHSSTCRALLQPQSPLEDRAPSKDCTLS